MLACCSIIVQRHDLNWHTLFLFVQEVYYSSGYRLYFGQVDLAIVLLLCGGDKSSQDRDIQKAKKYWLDYEERESTN